MFFRYLMYFQDYGYFNLQKLNTYEYLNLKDVNSSPGQVAQLVSTLFPIYQKISTVDKIYGYH